MARKRYFDPRAAEKRDAGMIPSARGMANMPQQVVMREWPRVEYNGYEGLNDTIKGIDVQMRDDNRMKKKGRFPEKY